MKTQQQVSSLIQFSFHHLMRLPQQNIREAVILVSVHDGIEHAFKAITNLELSSDEYKKPIFYRLDKSIPIIYPSQAFLNSQHNHNFVSMYYLLNKVKRAKFIFAFKHSDLVQQPIKNIKQTMTRFVSLFAKTVQEPSIEISSSCGYIICQAKLKIEKYINLFSGMYAENYIKDTEVKNLCKKSMQAENIILIPKGSEQNNHRQQFIQLVKRMDYFSLPSKVEPGNLTAQRDYEPDRIFERWQVFIKKIYINLDVLIKQSKENEKVTIFYQSKINQNIRMEQLLCQQPERVISKDYHQKEWQLKIKFSEKTLRLCTFMECYLTLIDQTANLSLTEYKEHQKITQQFMRTLFDYGYLTRYSIYLYIVGYFKIQSFFPNNQEHKINFKQILGDIKLIDEKMTFLINQLYTQLEQQIVSANIGYPFVEIIKQLSKIYDILIVKKYRFATQRTFKKLIKYKAQLSFRRAIVVTNAYNIPKAAIREAWLQFLRYAHESTLIQSSKIQIALTFVAEELVKIKQFKLALKVYSNIPQYKSYKKIIAIYERDYKFNPQILKYTLSFDWLNKRKLFQNYCKFLLKIGFYQKVRALCLEGMKVIEEDEDGIELLKSILMNARDKQGRDIHIQFLRNLNQQQKQIKLDRQLLISLQQQFGKK